MSQLPLSRVVDIGEGDWNGPMFCGSGVVFRLVVIWYGGRTLASKRSGYGRILVRGGRDVIPGVLRPDIVVLSQEPGLMG